MSGLTSKVKDGWARWKLAHFFLRDIQDVDVSTTLPTSGQALLWNSTDNKWEPGTAGGFDPNETPVIIGSGATAGGGSTPSSVAGGASHATAIGRSAGASGTDSVAIGSSATTGQGQSVAVGFSATVSGTDGIAIGNSAGANNSQAVAIGRQATGQGIGVVAVGYLASTNGSGGVAVGRSASAGSTDSIAIGHSASVPGANSVVVGDNSGSGVGCAEGVAIGSNAVFDSSTVGATAVGGFSGARYDRCTAIGYRANTNSAQADSTALGANSDAVNNHSTALGADSSTTANHQVMLGAYGMDFVEANQYDSTYGSIVVMSSPNGTRYALQVGNSGAFTVIASPV